MSDPAEFAPCGVPLIGSNCQKSAMQREIESLRASLTRVEEERDALRRDIFYCDQAFSDADVAERVNQLTTRLSRADGQKDKAP